MSDHRSPSLTMAIDVLLASGASLPTTEYAWDERDVILYHLGVGAGREAPDLEYTWERHLKVLPTFGVVAPMASVEPVLYSNVDGLDFDFGDVLHGEQELTLHGPLPIRGRCENRARIAGVYDKGNAALLDVQVDSHLDGSDEPLFTNRFRLFVRGEGGFGGEREQPRPDVEVPDREPDARIRTKTVENQALLYRLSGDRNPLHIDPALAIRVGFERPILHGLCTYGIACKAAVDTLLGRDTAAVRSFRARFAGVVYPGESVVTELWREEGYVVLRSETAERGTPVLANSRLDFATGAAG
jgi:acyl dehydratase